MKKKIGVAVCVCAVLACMGIAQAQYVAGSHEAGITAGAAIPMTKIDLTAFGGKTEVAVKTGITFSGRYLYHGSPKWAFGAEVSYAGFGEKEHDASASGAIFRVSDQSMTFEGVAKYTFSPENKTRPYLICGLGYGSRRQKTETKPSTGFTWSNTGTTEYRTNYEETIGGAAFSFGFGLESFLSDTIVLGLEGRWKELGTKKTVQDNLFYPATWGIKSSNSFLATAVIGWKFGK